jgi:hypothetical protein
MNITNEQYEGILDVAPPDHNSEEFLQFLRDNNVVVLETPEWLVIENVKYHTPELPWYTAFDKGIDKVIDFRLQMLQWEFPEYRYIVNSVYARTVKRFHVHLLRVDKEYILRAL